MVSNAAVLTYSEHNYPSTASHWTAGYSSIFAQAFAEGANIANVSLQRIAGRRGRRAGIEPLRGFVDDHGLPGQHFGEPELRVPSDAHAAGYQGDSGYLRAEHQPTSASIVIRERE
jgi:hypothetical protein